MNPGNLGFATSELRLQLYFLLGLVYVVITPILLPFMVINVYNQEYEGGAAFWPDVHLRIITGLIISQLLFMGLMSTKDTSQLTPKNRFEAAFVKFPLQEAMVKDTVERAVEPNLNLKRYLHDAYVHAVFKDDNLDLPVALYDEEINPLVPNLRTSQRTTPVLSKFSFRLASETEP